MGFPGQLSDPFKITVIFDMAVSGLADDDVTRRDIQLPHTCYRCQLESERRFHCAKSYLDTVPPWLAQRLKSIAPPAQVKSKSPI